MAEAFLRKYAGDKFEAFSAGLNPSVIHPYTVKVMEEVGISLEGQRAKHFNEYLGKKHFGYLITVCAEAEKSCPSAFPGVGKRIFWPFDDPDEFKGNQDEKLEKFREIRDQIDRRIREWLTELGIEVKVY
jgi:arsenate reductase